ncbi:MAG: purine-nucleoside phosphorylase [Bdellovibrionales bacterium]
MIDQELDETLAYIREHSRLEPGLGFILGSGLSAFGNRIEVDAAFSFGRIPHFSPSTVEGHPGRLLVGHLEGVPVAVMQGRLHAYEGLSMQEVIYPVRVLARMGVRTLVVTNAAGGLKASMKPGDFMIIRDHINLTGENPLRGANWMGGPRFVDMTHAYDPELAALLKQIMKAQKVRHREGVYVGVMGPTYETAAEIALYGRIGGGAVGMSTVAEVMAARHAGLRVAGISCITNLGTGLSPTKLSHEEVKQVAHLVEDKFIRILVEFTRRIEIEPK